jgi:Protein of unknown function (DUF3088)
MCLIQSHRSEGEELSEHTSTSRVIVQKPVVGNVVVRDKLFLLKPDFQDGGDQRYYCPHCAQLEGVLSFYPRLRKEIDVEYVDFARPRLAIVKLLGEENQDAPVLVVGGSLPPSVNVDNGSANGQVFISGEENIGLYLAQRYGIGLPH